LTEAAMSTRRLCFCLLLPLVARVEAFGVDAPSRVVVFGHRRWTVPVAAGRADVASDASFDASDSLDASEASLDDLEEASSEIDVVTVDVWSFLYGMGFTGLVGAAAGLAYGRKLLIERKAGEELELASIASAARNEAERLTEEAEAASDALDALEDAAGTPVPQISSAYAILAWLRQRRNAPKVQKILQVKEEREARAREATEVAEKTAQLTSLDLAVVDDLETAEIDLDNARANLEKRRREDPNIDPNIDPTTLRQAEEALERAKANLDQAKNDALQVARDVVESKEAIIAQLHEEEETLEPPSRALFQE